MNSTMHGMRAAFAALLAFQGLQAACGLHFCPRDTEVRKHAFEAGLAVLQTGFYLNGHGGQYTEIIPAFQYTANGRILAGLLVPVASLDVEGETHVGLENPVVYGEWRFHPQMGNHVGLGLQLELPFGDHHHGLASDHFMIVPYLSLGKGMDPWFVAGQIGLSTSLELEHHHDDAGDPPLFHYVRPHEDREFLYRAGVGLSLWDKTAEPELYLSGQQVLVDEKESVESDHDLFAGLLFPIKLGSFTVTPRAEIPILHPPRFDWSVGLGLKARF